MALQLLKKLESAQTVIWDWNGTILNDSRIGTEAEAEIFRRYGLRPQTHEERLRNFSMPVQKYYERMGFDFSKVAYEKVADEWLSVYESLVKEAPLFEGMMELLNELKRLGKKQFVLSAAPQEHLLEMVDKHSIGHFFTGIYGLSNSHGDSKIERGRELLRDFQVESKTTILIGDTVHDFEVAQALGTEVLLIADGYHALETLLEVHPHAIASRYTS